MHEADLSSSVKFLTESRRMVGRAHAMSWSVRRRVLRAAATVVIVEILLAVSSLQTTARVLRVRIDVADPRGAKPEARPDQVASRVRTDLAAVDRVVRGFRP